MRLALFVFFGCSVMLADSKGLRPRSDVNEYRAHDAQNGVTIAADVMDAEQARHAFASSVYNGYAVVEVAVFPEAGKTVELSSMDFTLRLAGHPSPIRPATARTVAAVLHRKAASPPAQASNATVYPTAGVGYESGGYDPVYGGPRRGGWRTSAGVDIAAGGAPNGRPAPAPSDRGRSTMEAELNDKALPEGPASKAVAGYLYFPLPAKKKASDVTSLDYRGDAVSIHISSPAGSKRK